MSRKLALLGLALLVLVFAASGVLFLPIPFTRDQGIYSYVAWCWLGEWWPYQYAFEHKGPNLYLAYAVFLKVSRGATWGPNLGDLLARISTLVLLFMLARKIFNDKAALLSALFAGIPLLCIFSSCWWNDQAETFMMPLSPLAALLVFESSRNEKGLPRLLYGAAAGLALSQMLMFKPSSAWLVLAFLIFLLRFSKARISSALVFCAGVAAGLAAWFLYFWLRGIGGEFFEEVVLFNWFHLQGHRLPAATLAYVLRQGLWLSFGPGMVLAAAGFLRALKNQRQPAMFLALVWFVAGVLEILLQARFFLYHFLVLIPAAGLIAAIGAGADNKDPGRLWRGLSTLVILAWIGLAASLYYSNQSHYQTWKYLTGKIGRNQYLSLFQEPQEGDKKDFSALADYVVAGWIRERTRPDDYVLIFGYEPLINYLSARRSPTRFHSDYPLDFEARTGLAKRMQAKWRGIFLSELKERRPKLVVLAHNDINALEPEDSYDQAMKFTEFWDWLNANYRRKEQIEDFEFWWREDQ
jgi:4-amino-4-deoxy-L-arabinose transferase-like glycosyltransferase